MGKLTLATFGGLLGAAGDLIVAFAHKDLLGIFIASLGLIPIEGWQVLASGLTAAILVCALVGAVVGHFRED